MNSAQRAATTTEREKTPTFNRREYTFSGAAELLAAPEQERERAAPEEISF